MNYLWDTNILVHYLRRSELFEKTNRDFNFFTSGNRVFLSIINIGEVESIAYQRNWGASKWTELQRVVSSLPLLNIYDETIHAYARIDAYSQGTLLGRPLPVGLSARNMGKNDLWLAATAHVGNFTFVTTDLDFGHLQDIFIDLRQV